MRGNFVDIPTDCPQRDERLGWTGDIEVFAPTATFLYDCAGFLESWLRDLAAEQRDDGTVPWVIPDSLDWLLPAAVWGDAAVTVPSTAVRALRRRRHAARAVRRACGPGSSSSSSWRATTASGPAASSSATGSIRPAPDGDAFDQRTDPDLVATAAMIHSLDLVATAADLLERARRRTRATPTRARRAEPRSRASTSPRTDARVATRRPRTPSRSRSTLCRRRSSAARGRAARRSSSSASWTTIATGFVGTPLDLRRADDTGHVDTAYGLLLQERVPVVAVSGAAGRDDDLGTLGCDHARGPGQPAASR